MGNAREAEEENVVGLSDLEFAYPGQKPLISKFSLKLNPGARCFFSGTNGAGGCYLTFCLDKYRVVCLCREGQQPTLHGLETSATHIACVEDGKLKKAQPIKELPIFLPPSKSKNSVQVVEVWLSLEREEVEEGLETEVKLDHVTHPADVSPFTSSRQMAYCR